MSKLLIVVDFQNDFVSGSLGFEKAKLLEDVIYQKILDYKSKNYQVIYTLDTHQDNYLETNEGKKLPIKHCIIKSRGHEVYGRVNNLVGKDRVFQKDTFPSLDLANYLQGKSFEEVELCGLVSNICILSNAIMVRSALPEAKIIIDAKATASFDDDLHKKSLDIMKGLYFEIVNEK